MANDTVNLASTGCTGYDTEGPDMFYKATFTAGKNYKIKLTPASGYNPALYVLSSCTKPAGACLSGADSGYSGGVEEIVFSPTSSGVYTIAVDTHYASSDSYATGKFTLDVTEFTAPQGDVCNKPLPLTLSGGKVTTSGDTIKATNTVKFSSSSGCTATTGAGPEVFYSVNLTAGTSYKLELTPSSSYNPAVYVFTSCASPLGSCLGGANGASNGSAEKLFFTAKTSGPHIIAVDGAYSSSSGSGTFSLSLSEFKVPANTICSKAQALKLVSGKATVSGDTAGAIDEYNTVKCGGSALKGPQLYYSVQMKANQAYKLELNPTFYSYLYVFPAGACSSAASIDAACGSKGKTGDKYGTIYSGSPKSIMFTPSTAGPHVIAVDSTSSTSSTYSGKFTLDVSEFATAANSTCAKAQVLKLVSGKASVKGDTTGAKDEYSTLKCGTSSTLLGSQVYYKVTLVGGKSYAITLKPTFSSYLYYFSATACGNATSIGTACGSKGSTGDYSSVSANGTGTLIAKPATTTTYVIAVDAYSSSYYGSFALDVGEFNAPAHDSCKTAKKITLVSGKATVKELKIGATNKLSKCGTMSLPATDLWYRFTPIVGKTYKITFKPVGTNGGRFGVWDGSHNCVASAVETACGVLGSKYVTKGSTGTTSITSKGGDIYFVADGILNSLYDVYDYTFEIEQQ